MKSVLLEGHVESDLFKTADGTTYIKLDGKKVKVRSNRCCTCHRKLLFKLGQFKDGTPYLDTQCPTLHYGSCGPAHFIESVHRQTTLDLFGGTI